MSFSLYRCSDDSYVIVPLGLSPPMTAIRKHGEPFFVPATPRNLFVSDAWDTASRRIDRDLFAVIDSELVRQMFDVGREQSDAADRKRAGAK